MYPDDTFRTSQVLAPEISTASVLSTGKVMAEGASAKVEPAKPTTRETILQEECPANRTASSTSVCHKTDLLGHYPPTPGNYVVYVQCSMHEHGFV